MAGACLGGFTRLAPGGEAWLGPHFVVFPLSMPSFDVGGSVPAESVLPQQIQVLVYATGIVPRAPHRDFRPRTDIGVHDRGIIATKAYKLAGVTGTMWRLHFAEGTRPNADLSRTE